LGDLLEENASHSVPVPFVEFRSHSLPVTGLALCPFDFNLFASCSLDRKMILWNIAEKRSVRIITLEASLESIIFSPAGTQVIVGASNGRLYRVPLLNDGEIESLDAHSGSVCSLCISRRERKLVSGSTDGNLKSWIQNEKEELVLSQSISLAKDKIIAIDGYSMASSTKKTAPAKFERVIEKRDCAVPDVTSRNDASSRILGDNKLKNVGRQLSWTTSSKKSKTE
jgi:WD40 repeat protein